MGTLAGAALLAVAAIALVAASQAAATTFCAVEEDPCSAESTYGLPLEFGLSANGQATFSAATNMTCSGTTGSVELTEESGEDLIGKLSSLTFTGCSSGCTITAQSQPYEIAVEETSSWDGTVELTGTEAGKKVQFKTVCSGLECVYGSSKVTMKAEGGNPAALIANGSSFAKESGSFFCTSTMTWSASYSITEYEPVFLVNAGASTTLCQAKPLVQKDGEGREYLECEAGKSYSGSISGTLSKSNLASIESTDGVIKGAVTCTQSTFAGEFRANGTSVKGKGITAWTMTTNNGKCASTVAGLANEANVTFEGLPYSVSRISYLSATPGEGALTIAKPNAQPTLKLTFGTVVCQYERTSTSTGFFNDNGAEPTEIIVVSYWTRTNVEAKCPLKVKLENGLEVTRPGGKLYVAES